MTAPFSNTPSRISGPLVSSMVPMGRPSSSRRRIHNPELFQMFLMGAMGEIEPGHIHTRFPHTPESCLIGTGWPQRTDNLCLAHQTIHHTFLYAAVAVLFSLYRSSLEIATENAPGLQNRSPFTKCRSLPILLHLFRFLFGPRGFLAPSPLTNAPGCIMLTVLAILVH